MGNTPVCTIDQNGIHKPNLATCLAYFTGGYQGIYGSDSYLGSDDQDGELLGLWGAGIDDVNTMCVAAYRSYSPATAQGVGLDSNVKINNIQRKVPTNSTAPFLVIGTVGLPLPGVIMTDEFQNQWLLDPIAEVPLEGQITVTGTCQTIGAIIAASGAISTIQNPTRGLVSVVNTAAATPGAPVERDAQLRQRQAVSTTQPAQSAIENVAAAVWGLPGIARLYPYENDTETTDANSVPGNSISIVVDGGDAAAIAQAIATSKSGGCGTYGTTSQTVVNKFGVPIVINFYYVVEPPIKWALSIVPLNGFSLSTITLIQASLAAWTNGLGIGVDIELTAAYAACYLQSSIQSAVADLNADLASGDQDAVAADMATINSLNVAATTYKVQIGTLQVARDSNSLAAADITIAYFEAAACIAPNNQGMTPGVTVNVV